jgi:phosphohistidine phosphatase
VNADRNGRNRHVYALRALVLLAAHAGARSINMRVFVTHKKKESCMQRLMIIRHAIAHDRDPNQWRNDDRRPLSAAGKRKFRDVARQLHALIDKPDVLLTSDLTRSVQTARILTKYGNFPEAKILTEARPGVATPRVIAALTQLDASVIALVGHEPSLSSLISTLLTGGTRGVQGELKKGAIVLLEFKGRIKAGRGRLLAYCPPRVFARTAR